MSGHSKWKTIKHKKGIADAKRGNLFTKVAKLITIAVREGGADPESNFKLRLAIDKAKQGNMPKENIQRAIDRGAGKSDGSDFKEVVYEGFGPESTAFMLEVTTDNTNRTFSDLKAILAKGGGNLGGSGAVAYLFDKVGYLLIDVKKSAHEEKMLELMEIDDILDVESSDEGIEVYTHSDKLYEVKDQIVRQELAVNEAELIYKPKSLIKIADRSKAEKIINFTQSIEDHDDVQKVHANFDIDEELI